MQAGARTVAGWGHLRLQVARPRLQAGHTRLLVGDTRLLAGTHRSCWLETTGRQASQRRDLAAPPRPPPLPTGPWAARPECTAQPGAWRANPGRPWGKGGPRRSRPTPHGASCALSLPFPHPPFLCPSCALPVPFLCAFCALSVHFLCASSALSVRFQHPFCALPAPLLAPCLCPSCGAACALPCAHAGALPVLLGRLHPLLVGGHEAVARLQALLDLGVVDLVLG